MLILVRMSQTPEVVQQKAGGGSKMSLQLESGMRDAIGVLGYDIVTNCAKQIGAEGHDVPTRVSGFHVGMLVMMVGYCEPNAVTRACVRRE